MKLFKGQVCSTNAFPFTLLINLSQNPPHHGARSIINLQVIVLLFRYLITSAACAMFKIILEEDLKVFALSEINVAGKPRRLTNLRNIKGNDCSDISEASSRCTALVEAVKRHMYGFYVLTLLLGNFS